MAKLKSSTNVLIFVCLVLFFDAMGVALILPVLPDLIKELGGLPNDAAAKIAGFLLFTYAAAQFVCAPILGGLSDRFGRRPVLLLALFGFSLDYFVMAAAPTLAWLFIARLISGVLGATFPAANACIVDITAPEHRARNFGLTGASFGPWLYSRPRDRRRPRRIRDPASFCCRRRPNPRRLHLRLLRPARDPSARQAP